MFNFFDARDIYSFAKHISLAFVMFFGLIHDRFLRLKNAFYYVRGVNVKFQFKPVCPIRCRTAIG